MIRNNQLMPQEWVCVEVTCSHHIIWPTAVDHGRRLYFMLVLQTSVLCPSFSGIYNWSVVYRSSSMCTSSPSPPLRGLGLQAGLMHRENRPFCVRVEIGTSLQLMTVQRCCGHLCLLDSVERIKFHGVSCTCIPPMLQVSIIIIIIIKIFITVCRLITCTCMYMCSYITEGPCMCHGDCTGWYKCSVPLMCWYW